ncbi:MAG: hypothetical protein ACOYNN_17630, partial [Terrimicrobiaceae bacterium]
MVQPKHNPQEALERMKLMMKYDSSKTLTENVEVVKENKKPINEGLVMAIPAIAAAWAWWNYGDRFNNPAQKVKGLFSSCPTLLKQSEPSTDVDFSAAADKINDGVNDTTLGLPSTDEDAVKAGFEMMKIPADICKLEQVYREKYGDLYGDLQGDFSGNDWNKYIWSPIYNIMSKVPKEEGKKEDEKNTDEKKPTPVPVPRKSQYTSCPDTFPINKFCKNSTISKVQGCLGIKSDGAFGPATQAALEAKGLSGTQIT